MSIATAREALIAEALGVLAKLVDRVEALPEAMDKAREEMREAAFFLDSRIVPIQHQMRAAVEQSKTIAMNDVRREAIELSMTTIFREKEAMTETARAIVRDEISPPLRQLAATLQTLIERTRRPQWETWVTYAATGAVSAAFAMAIAVYFVQGDRDPALRGGGGPASGVAGGRGVDLAPAGAAPSAARDEGQFDSGLVHAQREGGRDREPRPRERAASSPGSTRYR